MKLLNLLLISFFLVSCSFDDKSGIWKKESDSIQTEKNSPFKDFKKFSIEEEEFNTIINLDESFNFKVSNPITNYEWNDIYYNKNNNLKNFKYKNLNKIIFKSKKLSRSETNNYLLADNNNVILNDFKGNIFIFSLDSKNILTKFNFYKNKYKKIRKKLNILIENNIIFVSDNLGYLYSYDYIKERVLWAKKLDVPFRSNMKIVRDKLIVSNQNNELIFFDKKTGNIIKLIPTEEDIIKNKFVNNLSMSDKDLIFLNSFGSLYSINFESLDINWFINLNQSTDLSLSNLFLGTEIVNEKNKIIISSNQKTYIIDSDSGSILSRYNFSANIKPIIYNDYVFLVTKNNLIICINLNDGKILYSYSLAQLATEYLKIEKNKLILNNYLILNNEIFIFLENSFLMNLQIDGKFNEIKKLPFKINSQPIVINNAMIFLDKKNRLVVIN